MLTIDSIIHQSNRVHTGPHLDATQLCAFSSATNAAYAGPRPTRIWYATLDPQPLRGAAPAFSCVHRGHVSSYRLNTRLQSGLCCIIRSP
jgi:hypothetical protein